jgi:CD2 antigen cytoplasmic tail-binding protein 2
MSSSNTSKKRNVHFPAGSITDTQPPPQKKRRGIEEGNTTEDRKPSALRPSTFKNNNKNSNRNNKNNEDELDDIDDWNEREDGDNEEDPDGGNQLPSKSQLIEAKRKRRQIRGSGGALFNDDEDDDHMDAAETSLATDGVKIEPFHMRDEETDGTGFFDGDTYVFRKHPPLEDGEPDAWADTLMREDDDKDGDSLNIAVAKRQPHNNKSVLQEDLDELSKEQLYKRILTLLGETESIMQAIQRYGKLVKNPRKQKYGGKKNAIINKSIMNDDKCNVAKKSLDELTGTANALLLKGEVDIYDTTKKGICRMFPSLEQQTNNNIGTAKNNTDIITKWEYQGNEDNELHGPYTTEQMLEWKKAGYFVGIQRVKIRTVQEEKSEEKESLSTEEDLLNDLMDDDDDDDDDDKEEVEVEDESRPNKKAKNTNTGTVKGEWMWSNEVDYQKYL